jgi:hypothetical protein
MDVMCNATTSQSVSQKNSAPTDVLKQILSSQDFGEDQDTWGIRSKNQRDPKELPDINLVWIEKIKEFFGLFLLTILIMVIIVAAGYILLRLYKLRKSNVRTRENKWKSSFAALAKNTVVQYPRTLLAEALLLHEQGMIRDAWAKCFLAAIAIYSAQSDLYFPIDATEYDCLSIVRKAKARDAEGFSNLVFSWTSLAYGDNKPTVGLFEKAIEFCNSLSLDEKEAASHA